MQEMSRNHPRDFSNNRNYLKNTHNRRPKTSSSHQNISHISRQQSNSIVYHPKQQLPQKQNHHWIQQSNHHLSPENKVGALEWRNVGYKQSQYQPLPTRKRQSDTTVQPQREFSEGVLVNQDREGKAVYEIDSSGNRYRVYGQNNYSYGSRTTLAKQNVCEVCCSCILATCCCCCGAATLYGAT